MVAPLLGLAPAARAGQDSHAEAERLIHHGIQLRRAHDDEGAQREFRKAYDLARTPRAAAQLGLAEQALGRWEDAERHVSEAVAAPGDPWVAKNRPALEGALGTIQAHLGRIEVIGDPVGASVSVNGKATGNLPLPDAVRVSAGEVDVDVRAPGYTPAQRTVSIVGGQYQKLVIHLAKEEPPAPEPVATPIATAAPRVAANPAAAPGDAGARVVGRATGPEMDGRRTGRRRGGHRDRLRDLALQGPVEVRPGLLRAERRRRRPDGPEDGVLP